MHLLEWAGRKLILVLPSKPPWDVYINSTPPILPKKTLPFHIHKHSLTILQASEMSDPRLKFFGVTEPSLWKKDLTERRRKKRLFLHQQINKIFPRVSLRSIRKWGSMSPNILGPPPSLNTWLVWGGQGILWEKYSAGIWKSFDRCCSEEDREFYMDGRKWRVEY
ncbi:hypothetical protein TNIN_304851 [Trichonephila inaurata madagascariensis]|uniref:Uncharacterized protein n=1 Tax=Trichonephila inaurata madagascariensis TaxID=2747483 RepID=A0A8X6MK12_9ARAC|nr:hypothetical protein TNIN_304851 [Trichonephila inaurata madagascariensis]